MNYNTIPKTSCARCGNEITLLEAMNYTKTFIILGEKMRLYFCNSCIRLTDEKKIEEM